MSTTIKPELSKKNKYWIERHRFYELKHFCLQYPIWKKMLSSIDGLSGQSGSLAYIFNNTSLPADPTATRAELRTYFMDRIQMVEQTAWNTDFVIAPYILKGVTEGISYDLIRANEDVPCCKDIYYELYRRFFWLLDKVRK